MFELAPSRKIILALLMAALICMLGVSLMQRLSGEPLVIQRQEDLTSTTVGGSQMSSVMSEIGTHMEELKNDPNNYDLLVHTADLLVQAEQWEAAESFLRRAIALKEQEAQPHFLLGIVLHSTEKHAEAAEALEKVIAINNDPSARYSLGVLYIYYLDKALKGTEHLKKALEHADLAPELRTAIEAEIQKLSTQP